MRRIIIKDCTLTDLEILANVFVSKINVIPSQLILEGEVGTGKTTFTRLLLEKMGTLLPFSSPTYSLVNIYDDLSNEKVVNHFDVYRATQDDYEWIFEMFDEKNEFFIIEWASMHPELIEKNHTFINFEYEDEFHRLIEIRGNFELIDEVKRRMSDANIVFEE